MPLYDFLCEPCVLYMEIRQGVDEPSTRECPSCGQTTLKKVFINSPAIIVRGEPATIGQVADRNSKKLGKYERDSLNNKNNIAQKKEVDEKRKLHRKINAMTEEQKVKWIKEGD